MTGPEFASLRKFMGLTQQQLAEIAGVHYQLIQKIEYGKRKLDNHQGKTLLALAQALRVEMEELVQ